MSVESISDLMFGYIAPVARNKQNSVHHDDIERTLEVNVPGRIGSRSKKGARSGSTRC